MNKQTKIGVVGLIGSGKTTVCKILRKLGACVVSADKINAERLKQEYYLDKLRSVFPDALVPEFIRFIEREYFGKYHHSKIIDGYLFVYGFSDSGVEWITILDIPS